jgi:hypothetical protein
MNPLEMRQDLNRAENLFWGMVRDFTRANFRGNLIWLIPCQNRGKELYMTGPWPK